MHSLTVASLSHFKSHENSVFFSKQNRAALMHISRNVCLVPSAVQAPLITLLVPVTCCRTLAVDSMNIVIILLLFILVYFSRAVLAA